MTDSSPTPNINIGQDAKGVIGYNVFGNTIIQEQKLLITPEAIELNPFQARSPYKALKRFDVDDSEYFFGRYQLTRELQATLETSNLILVLGASGSGKSSVVRAKLIPEFLAASSHRHDFVLTPKDDPFQSLYESLIGRDKVGPDKGYCFSESKAQFVLEGKPKGKPDVLAQVVRQLKDKDAEWLIFIDQFEELFTRCTSSEQRKNFIKSIAQIAESDDRSVKIVLAMRADFLGEFNPYPQFGKLVQRQIHLVNEMPEDELELAIKGPAAKHGVRFEPGLAKEIIADVQGQAGSLPLMQYTLDRLWEYEVNLDKLADRTLNTQNYQALGKVRGALEQHVNEIYGELGAIAQQATKQIFLSLVKVFTKDGIDKRVSQSVARSALQGEAVPETIDQLINENLLVSSSKNLGQAVLPTPNGNALEPQATIEIAHEILLTSWTKLQEWIQEAQATLLIKSRLVEDMGRWNEQKQANQELLKSSVLAKVLELKEKHLFELQSVPLSAAEEAYIAASQRFQKQELNRARRVAVGASIGAGLMAGVAIFAAIQVRKAEMGQIQTFVALSKVKLANNQSLDADIDSIRAGKALQQSWWQKFWADPELKLSVLGQSQQMGNTGQERNRLEGHQGSVHSVVFSPDGKQLATSGYDGTARLWDTAGKPLAQLKGHSVVFSPDGKQLATSGEDGTVRLWDTAGKPLAQLKGHQGSVYSVVFSPDGKQLATSGEDGSVRLWDTAGKPLAQLKGHQGRVTSVVFSPDSKQLATSGYDGTVRLWDTAGKPLAQLKGHQGRVTSVVFRPDGKQLVTLGEDGTARLWDTAGEPLAQLKGHQGSVWSVVFSPDGKQLATNGEDGTARIWDTAGKPLAQLKGHQGRVTSVVFSPDGKQLATNGEDDGTVSLWDTAGKPLAQLKGHQGSLHSVVFSPDGKQLVTLGEDGTARIWDTAGKPLAQLKGHQGSVYSVVFSPDGKQLATSGYDGTARIWDTAGKPLAQLSHQGRVTSVVFSPDGKQLVTLGEDDGTARLWDTAGKPLAQFKGYSVFSPDGKQLATSGEDGTARIWDTAGKPLAQLKGHQGRVWSVVFSPDSKQLATSGEDGTARIWDTAGKPLAQLKGHQGSVWSVVFSPDGKQLATLGEDGTARIWDTAGKPLAQLKGHQGSLHSVVFSPDGKQLVTLGEDGTARIWDTAGKPLAQLKGDQGIFHSVVFSPDGKQLATSEDDGTARLWQIGGIDELLSKQCHWVRDYLTNSPRVTEGDRHLCDGIGSGK
jgi:WD40 repeat protein/energy-coupling factor transporter ATP-binding protein EcfA2